LRSTLRVKDGAVLSEQTVPFPDVARPQEPVALPWKIAIPATLPAERVDASLRLTLLDGNGATVAENDYAFTLCRPSYARAEAAAKNGEVIEKPEVAPWPAILKRAEAGERVVVLNPGSLPETLTARG